jgi:predicted kinase
MTPKLILLIGIPGSGKSSWLEEQGLYTNPAFAILCPDQVRKELVGDISDQSRNVEVWETVKKRTISYLEQGISVVLDATNVSTTNRRNFIQGLPPCILQAKLFPADPAQCFARIIKDLELHKDRANVPEEVIYRMYGEYLYSEKIVQLEGFEIIDGLPGKPGYKLPLELRI